MMRVQTDETRTSVIAFAPKKGSPDATMVADDAGHGIVALVQKAGDLAKADCDRAMKSCPPSFFRAAGSRGKSTRI